MTVTYKVVDDLVQPGSGLGRGEISAFLVEREDKQTRFNVASNELI